MNHLEIFYQRLLMIKEAVQYQACDEGLSFTEKLDTGTPITMTEIYLQQSLRDLHSVIEHGDEDALKRIKERSEEQ